MTFLVNLSNFRRLALAAGAAFLAAIAVLSLGGRTPSVPAPAPETVRVHSAGGTLGEIARLQSVVRRAPGASAMT